MVFQNPDSTLNPAWSTRAILTRAVRKLGGARRGSVRAKVDKLSRRRARGAALPAASSPPSSRAARSSASPSPAPSPATRRWWSATSPPRPSTCRCRPASSTCSSSCRPASRSSYVFISHDLAVVRYISDRIGVMYLAELIEVGSAEEVFNPPHHPYTEALLSSIPKLDFEHQRQRIPLRGTMPSLSEPPTGCRFHTRCHRFLGDICVRAGAALAASRRRPHLQVPHPAGRAPRAAARGARRRRPLTVRPRA